MFGHVFPPEAFDFEERVSPPLGSGKIAARLLIFSVFLRPVAV
jgi:hypothetical protein